MDGHASLSLASCGGSSAQLAARARSARIAAHVFFLGVLAGSICYLPLPAFPSGGAGRSSINTRARAPRGRRGRASARHGSPSPTGQTDACALNDAR